jgi:hypothetical protein
LLAPHTIAQGIEVMEFDGFVWLGFEPGQNQTAQTLAILTLASQLANVFATGAATTLADLFIDESLERIRRGNFDRAHIAIIVKIGPTLP